jgi:quinol---cytochrome c reductase iron-sulfur subunit, bacillus type
VADDLERPEESPEHHGSEPHLPAPTIWPFAFAGGIALVLIGLIVNLWVTVIGAIIAVVFGFFWILRATREQRAEPPPEPAPLAAEPEAAFEGPSIGRKHFLEASTLGIGAAIGGIVTLPIVGFAILPAFVDQGYDEIDLGPLENFPEGEFVTTTFFSRNDQGDVGRRTAFVRYNGAAENGEPSFTIISNRCVHLGCPTQPLGLPGEPKTVETSGRDVDVTPVASVSGFGCPCHGGAYNDEGNRTAGPPVRSLDRYQFAIKNGNLWLGTPYSVGTVDGTGADAVIHAYGVSDPGVHVDGPEQIFYPYVPG